MKNTRKAFGGIAVLAGGLAAICFSASPALAANGVLLPTVGSGASGAHHVTASCTPGAGVATNLNQITYAIAATASSYSTNGSVPVGTTVQCFAYRVSTKGVYASIAGGLPGPDAAAAGTVTVPTNVESKLCAKANAVFNDNGTATFNNCPF